MRQDNHERPRLIAGKLVSAFINGETNIDMITAGKDVQLVKLAQTLAKNTAAMVIFHARAARKAKSYDVVPKPLRDLVITYQHSKNRIAKGGKAA